MALLLHVLANHKINAMRTARSTHSEFAARDQTYDTAGGERRRVQRSEVQKEKKKSTVCETEGMNERHFCSGGTNMTDRKIHTSSTVGLLEESSEDIMCEYKPFKSLFYSIFMDFSKL